MLAQLAKRTIREICPPIAWKGLKFFKNAPSSAKAVLQRAKRLFVRPSLPVEAPRRLGNNIRGQLVRLRDFCIYVDAADRHIGRTIREHFCYEPHVERMLRGLLKPGEIALDIGANVGFHSLVAAMAVGPGGRVFSIEMSSTNCTLLRASMRANPKANITLIESAVAESRQPMVYCLGAETGNGMVVNDHMRQAMAHRPDKFTSVMEVLGQPVDDLIPANVRVNLVKIDIEGFELQAFRGMKRILRDSRPTIVFEFFPHLLGAIGETEPTELLEFLRGYGYRFSSIDGNHGLGNDLSNPSILELAGTGLIDLLGTPPEMQ